MHFGVQALRQSSVLSNRAEHLDLTFARCDTISVPAIYQKETCYFLWILQSGSTLLNLVGLRFPSDGDGTADLRQKENCYFLLILQSGQASLDLRSLVSF